MTLVKIAKDVYVNPEKVISVRRTEIIRQQIKAGTIEKDTLTIDKEIIIYVHENNCFSSGYFDRIKSDYSLEETVKMLTEVKGER